MSYKWFPRIFGSFILVCIVYFSYRWMAWTPPVGPMVAVSGKVAVAMEYGLQELNQRTMEQTVVQRRRESSKSCRQLPEHLNRTELSSWGKNEYGRYVQLEYPLLEYISDEAQIEYWNFASQWTAIVPSTEPGRALEDTELKQKLARAIRRVLMTDDVPCAYEWHAVRGVVALHGELLVLKEHGDVSAVARYDARSTRLSPYRDALRISDREAEELSDLSLSRMLVANATAAVFARSIAALSGYMPDTLDAFRVLCSPFNRSYVGYEAAAIAWNEGRFLATVPDVLSGENLASYRTVASVDEENSKEMLSRIATRVSEFGIEIFEINGHWSYVRDSLSCRFPPQLNGTDRGREYYLSDADHPVIHFVLQENAKVSKMLAMR